MHSILQHNLFQKQYTYSNCHVIYGSKIPILKITSSKYASVSHSTSLFNINFFPLKPHFQFRKQIIVIRREIWRIWGMVEHFVVRFIKFLDCFHRCVWWCIILEKQHFFLPYGAFYFLFFCWNNLVMLHNTLSWIFYLSHVSRETLSCPF